MGIRRSVVILQDPNGENEYYDNCYKQTQATILHVRFSRLLPDVANTGTSRSPGGSVDVIHPAGRDEVVVRCVLSYGDFDRLHLRKLTENRGKYGAKGEREGGHFNVIRYV